VNYKLSDTQQKRFGGVALVGATNAGKSTLLNAMIGEKLAITSRKVQTTRFQIRAILTKDQSQIVFIDTPGFFKPRRKFDRAMIATAWQSLDDVEVAALLIDASKPFDQSKQMAYITKIMESKDEDNRILILNKVDDANKMKLLEMAQKIQSLCPFSQIFMVSALNNDGVQDIVKWCANAMPLGEWVYDADELTTMPSRILAAEITREKIYDRLHQELPYQMAVETEAFEDADNKKGLAIRQVIIIEDNKHKGIVLGRAGATLKIIGSEARAEMADIFQCPVHLELFVQHRANWLDKDEAFIDQA
jgi:GTP-binding protein Era